MIFQFRIQEYGCPERIVDIVTDTEIRIGTAPQSDLLFDDARVASRHALIVVKNQNDAVLIDLGSGWGTILMGKKIQQQNLRSGDIITLCSGTRVIVKFSKDEF
jgi:pSer/pThr/pTyr-binding forkhead associated (FHA) protein